MIRKILLAISAIDAFSALVCGVLLILAPNGSLMAMQSALPDLQAFPLADIFFNDFFWVGAAMIIVLGVPNAVATALTLRRNPS